MAERTDHDTDPRTGPTADDARRWAGRPMLAGALRAAILLAPAIASATAVFAAARFLPAPGSAVEAAGRLLLLLALGLSVAYGTERLARRLLPLTLVLKMTMLFPDRAPSRFRVARQACASRNPALLLHHPEQDASRMAERLVTLLASLATHDRHTRGHAERVQVLAELLGRQLRLSPADRDRLRWAALLHDIGKLSVSPAVLNKPGSLDDVEWAAVRAHPVEGQRLAAPLLDWLSEWGEAILHHHERFDGTGYPQGLAGEQISYAGRLVCVVDAYETMTAARSYKKAMATRDARAELARCAGSHFDPEIVRAFLSISLPRLLWAGGPLSFLLQLPFLPLIEAGGRIASGTLSAAGSGVVAGSTALVLTGAGAAAATPPQAPPAAVHAVHSAAATTHFVDATVHATTVGLHAHSSPRPATPPAPTPTPSASPATVPSTPSPTGAALPAGHHAGPGKPGKHHPPRTAHSHAPKPAKPAKKSKPAKKDKHVNQANARFDHPRKP